MAAATAIKTDAIIEEEVVPAAGSQNDAGRRADSEDHHKDTISAAAGRARMRSAAPAVHWKDTVKVLAHDGTAALLFAVPRGPNLGLVNIVLIVEGRHSEAEVAPILRNMVDYLSTPKRGLGAIYLLLQHYENALGDSTIGQVMEGAPVFRIARCSCRTLCTHSNTFALPARLVCLLYRHPPARSDAPRLFAMPAQSDFLMPVERIATMGHFVLERVVQVPPPPPPTEAVNVEACFAEYERLCEAMAKHRAFLNEQQQQQQQQRAGSADSPPVTPEAMAVLSAQAEATYQAYRAAVAEHAALERGAPGYHERVAKLHALGAAHMQMEERMRDANAAVLAWTAQHGAVKAAEEALEQLTAKKAAVDALLARALDLLTSAGRV